MYLYKYKYLLASSVSQIVIKNFAKKRIFS